MSGGLGFCGLWRFGLVEHHSEIPAIEHPAVLVLEHGSTQLGVVTPRLETPSACESETRNL